MNTSTGTSSVVVFNIVHGSFVDGPGVRTTLFLKGCPLRCVWCCNPEGQKRDPEIKFVAQRCDGCGKCLTCCPNDAIFQDSGPSGNVIWIDRTRCNACGRCIEDCHMDALGYFGKRMTVTEAFDALKRDERYYSGSGGGVTIGGGEPTFVPEFTYALMKKCQADNIHVAVDTCGYTISALGFKILTEADLLLYDIKGMDDSRHRRYTGVSNERILSNLTRLSSMGKPIIIRMPLIPGLNDSETEIRTAAEFLSQLKSVQRVDLIPYHQFGTVKYGQLGCDYLLTDVQPLPEDRIAWVLSLFEEFGMKTQVGG